MYSAGTETNPRHVFILRRRLPLDRDAVHDAPIGVHYFESVGELTIPGGV